MQAPAHQRGQGPSWDVRSVHRRPDYPLVGCAPAEPTSVSPGATEIPDNQRADKSNHVEAVCRVRKPGGE